MLRIWLCAALSLLVTDFALAQSQNPSEGTERTKQQPASEQRGTEQAPFVIRVQPSPEQTQIKPEAGAQKAPERGEDGWFPGWGLGDKLALINGVVAFLQFCALTATVAAMVFTARRQLKHGEAIERAYLVGGGGPDSNPPHHFILNVDNYGKTPASIKQFSFEICDLSEVKLPNKPKYLSSSYERKVLVDEIAPRQFKRIDHKDVPKLKEPVCYGRFWYRDLWGNERYYSFILSVKMHQGVPVDSRADIDLTGIDPEYTKWT